jgi:hypothetical protein
MNGKEITQGSLWTLNESKPKKVYCILESTYEGVVATTSIDVSMDKPDSFIWFSPIEDFLTSFTPVKSK